VVVGRQGRVRRLTKSSSPQRKLSSMKALLLAVGLTLPVSPVLAEATSPSDAPIVEAASLTEDQLRQAIIGKTIYLNVSGFELPIRYKANGRMSGSMGAVAATFSQGDSR
jgi:hypothetical protein